jgi:hypothetical protein
MIQKKIIIHYPPGGYGNFLEGLLSGRLQIDEKKHDYHLIDQDYSKSSFLIEKSHNYEELTEKLVVKITYDINDTALLNRNKWIKWPQNYEESKALTFPNINTDIDENIKEIVTKSFFSSDLLEKVDKWNGKINDHTIEVPFKFFISEHKEWISTAEKFLNECGITHTIEYLETAYESFQKSQAEILEQNKHYRSTNWRKKDNIEKANFLSKLYYEKITRDGNSVPPSKGEYTNTAEMLAWWVTLLDKNNGVLQND